MTDEEWNGSSAHSLGMFLSGFVRNQHDGSVEVSAEGDLDALLRFEQAVRRGPAGARVDDVQMTEAPASGRFAGFSVTG